MFPLFFHPSRYLHQRFQAVHWLVSFLLPPHLHLREPVLTTFQSTFHSEHMAGTGNDHLSALYLKSEYEELLGLPISGPLENVFDAGSVESQDATRGLIEADEARVWIDTVSEGDFYSSSQYQPEADVPFYNSIILS